MVLSLLTSRDGAILKRRYLFNTTALLQNNGSSQNKRFSALFPPPRASTPRIFRQSTAEDTAILAANGDT
jgi:hypothetical protein